MTKDNIIDCPLCSQKGACYATDINESKKAYLCLGCGFQTNDFLENGANEFIRMYESELPNLYKDLKQIDSVGRVWFPTVINIQDKGTVFANGKSVDEWGWSAIKNVPLNEEDKNKLIFKGKTHKSDSTSIKHFDKDFLSALEYIDIEF
jgi:hypothetical protein